MRRTVPGRIVRRGRYTWARAGLGGTETWGEGFEIVGTPVSGPGLPRVYLEPRRKRVLHGHGTVGRTVLDRNGSKELFQGELIPRSELGDNLIMSPRNGALLGERADISVVRPEIVLWGGIWDG